MITVTDGRYQNVNFVNVRMDGQNVGPSLGVLSALLYQTWTVLSGASMDTKKIQRVVLHVSAKNVTP